MDKTKVSGTFDMSSILVVATIKTSSNRRISRLFCILTLFYYAFQKSPNRHLRTRLDK